MKAQLLAFLKRVPTQAYIYAGIATVLIAGYNLWAYKQREIGRREAELVQVTADLRDAKMQIEALAKQYRVDTIRFRVIRTQTDTLTQTVERWKRDTLRVVEYVTKADSTIRVCTAALGTCEQRIGAVTRALDASEKANRILKQSFPSPAKPWIYGAIGVGAGYLAAQLRR